MDLILSNYINQHRVSPSQVIFVMYSTATEQSIQWTVFLGLQYKAHRIIRLIVDF